MNFIKVFQLHVVAFLVLSSTILAFDYAEIQKLNASCSPKDTCSLPRDLDNLESHNCDCSSLCVLYDTCCIDSPFLNISRHYDRAASCRSAGQKGETVFMIDVCSPTYKGSATIRRRCEHISKNWSDPFTNIPVTNPSSQKTYKSLFCALCNDEDPKELIMWQVVLDCSSLNEYIEMCTENRDFVLNNMMYIREKGLWGLWSYDSKSDWKFRYLPINLKIPPSIEHLVKKCRPNLISHCPSTWKDSRTKHLCKSYMGALYFNDVGFRNIHCAICNYVINTAIMSCHDTTKSLFKGPEMSFGLLLDIDLRDGDKVGNVNRPCEKDEVFDPFTKECRSVECPIPGFTLKNGQCVQS